MRDLGPETVVAILPVPKGKHGEPGVGTPTRTPIPGCAVYPRTSIEARNGRESTVITGLTLLAPVPAPAITAVHEVEWRGTVYAVEGEPGLWIFGDGNDAGLEVALRKGTD